VSVEVIETRFDSFNEIAVVLLGVDVDLESLGRRFLGERVHDPGC
jgi:hypothetical protein